MSVTQLASDIKEAFVEAFGSEPTDEQQEKMQDVADAIAQGVGDYVADEIEEGEVDPSPDGELVYYTGLKTWKILDTDAVPEGAVSGRVYYTATRARNDFSNTVTGLTYNPLNGVTSLTPGYAIPTVSELSSYAAKASRSDFSNTVTGLTYNPATGVTSLTAGYVIPTTAELSANNAKPGGSSTANFVTVWTGSNTLGGFSGFTWNNTTTTLTLTGAATISGNLSIGTTNVNARVSAYISGGTDAMAFYAKPFSASSQITGYYASIVSNGALNSTGFEALVTGTGTNNTYGVLITNSATASNNYGIRALLSGAGATNIAGYFSAQNGTTTNYAIQAANGDVYIQAGNLGVGVAPAATSKISASYSTPTSGSITWNNVKNTITWQTLGGGGATLQTNQLIMFADSAGTASKITVNGLVYTEVDVRNSNKVGVDDFYIHKIAFLRGSGAGGDVFTRVYGRQYTSSGAGSIGTEYANYVGAMIGTAKWSFYSTDSGAQGYNAGRYYFGTTTTTGITNTSFIGGAAHFGRAGSVNGYVVSIDAFSGGQGENGALYLETRNTGVRQYGLRSLVTSGATGTVDSYNVFVDNTSISSTSANGVYARLTGASGTNIAFFADVRNATGTNWAFYGTQGHLYISQRIVSGIDTIATFTDAPKIGVAQAADNSALQGYNTTTSTLTWRIRGNGATLWNGSLTGSGGAARYMYINPTITAGANNDALTVLNLTPAAYSDSTFTGTTKYILRIDGTGSLANADYAVHVKNRAVSSGLNTTINTTAAYLEQEVTTFASGTIVGGHLVARKTASFSPLGLTIVAGKSEAIMNSSHGANNLTAQYAHQFILVTDISATVGTLLAVGATIFLTHSTASPFTYGKTVGLQIGNLTGGTQAAGTVYSIESTDVNARISHLGAASFGVATTNAKVTIKGAAGANILDLQDSGGLSKLTVNSLGNLLLADGVTIALGTGTGTKIGTTSSEKIGFYGATPVARPAAILAVNSDPVNSGDATTDAVILNMRARINQLEAAQQLLGLLT